MSLLCLTLISPCVITLSNAGIVLLTPFLTFDKCQFEQKAFVFGIYI